MHVYDYCLMYSYKRDIEDKSHGQIGKIIMGNTDKFEVIANTYDTSERIHSKIFYTGSKIFMGHDASLFIVDSQK